MKALFKIYLELEQELASLANAALAHAEKKAESVAKMQAEIRAKCPSQIQEKVIRDEIQKLWIEREGNFYEAAAYKKALGVIKEKMLEHLPE
jgi:hypothetical protein